MGLITKQWLNGRAERNRRHYPVKVVIKLLSTNDSWSKRNGVAGALEAVRYGGDYQNLYLTKSELNEFLPILARSADVEACKRITLRTLLLLREPELFDFLTEVLSKRRALKLKKAAG